jgi:parallel beta-helix repeat protein
MGAIKSTMSTFRVSKLSGKESLEGGVMSKRHIPLLVGGLALCLALVAFGSLALAQKSISQEDIDVHINTPLEHIERQELFKPLVDRVDNSAAGIELVRLQIAETITVEARTSPIELFLPEAQLTEHHLAIQPIRHEIKAITGQVIDKAYPIPLSVSAYDSVSAVTRPAADCVVNSTADSGPGTLRQCLENAVAGDTVTFDAGVFSPTSPMTISLSSPLPWIITDNLTIDGSDAGVILDGHGLSSGFGIVITGTDGVKIQGLQIIHFPTDGVAIAGGATNTVIGGDRFTGSGPLGQGNLISGNGRLGVWLQDTGTMSNTVLSNYIGTDVSGTAALGNDGGGVAIGYGAANNTVGGNVSGTRNLISGNGDDGIQLQNQGTTGNQVLGNLIGTDASGTTALGNLGDGIFIFFEASNNIIGGDASGPANLISGNGFSGIWISSGAMKNKVLGNYIGTDFSGTASLGNTMPGVVIFGGARNNIVGGDATGARNLISGNDLGGVWIQGVGTMSNTVLGNYIGTDVSGTAALGNAGNGVTIIKGATNNTIGGDTIVGNLISGNESDGIWIQDPGTSRNRVTGNRIGTDVFGTTPLGNRNGVVISSAADNTIERNTISGNRGAGVWLQEPGTSANQVLGNYIGIDASGISALGNGGFGVLIGFGATNNIIGGNTPGARNLISGNGDTGVHIQNAGTMSNTVLGNYIGLDTSGTVPLGNAGSGVAINVGATNNVVGGYTSKARNIISGNKEDAGVEIGGNGTMGNIVLGNYIGTNVSGTVSLANVNGVAIYAGATNNIVGGTNSGTGNLISGNEEIGIVIWNAGTSKNQVLGNHVGTDASGLLSIPNYWGVVISEGPTDNTIGSGSPDMRNLISGNTQAGVLIEGSGTMSNTVLGNYIGTALSGRDSLPNLYGVAIDNGAMNNTIGGVTDGARNLISSNRIAGVWIEDVGTSENQVLGNYIGTDATGADSFDNDQRGVFIGFDATHNTIGISNTIIYNALAGVVVSGRNTLYNTVTRNVIHDNDDLPIDLVDLPIPSSPSPPVFIVCSSLDNTVWGTACPGCCVEIFANPTTTPAGTIFLGDIWADESGFFNLTLADSPPYPYIAATATDPDGTTSEFSEGFPCDDRLFKIYLPLVINSL